MAFSVQLFKFTKMMNSTTAPAAGSGTNFNCVLKDDCGIMSPVIKFDLGLSTNPSEYNYAYIPAFNRYYYVKEWQFTERLWYCYLEEDFLATWKLYIGSESFYILRAANKFDGTISDEMYPTFPTPIYAVAEGSSRPWIASLPSGWYVVGIINSSSSAMGAVGYYVFSNAQFKTFCAKLMENTDWLDVPKQISQGGIDDGLLKTLFNPFQYIVSCNWFPFKPATGEGLTSLPYGWWTFSGVSCSRLAADATNIQTVTFSLSKHPQAGVRGSYLNNSPYTEIELSFEPFGNLVLDPGLLVGESSITVYLSVDAVTGLGILEVGKTSGVDNYPKNIIKRAQAQVGVPIQIAQIAVDRLTQAETVISGEADVTASALQTASQATNISNLANPIGGELGAAATGAQTVSTATHAIANGIRASVPQMETTGVNGSIAAFSCIPTLNQKFYRLVDEDLANNGRPLCQIGKPSEIGGYMTVRNAHVYLPGTINEMAAVNAYLESGFYYG